MCQRSSKNTLQFKMGCKTKIQMNNDEQFHCTQELERIAEGLGRTLHARVWLVAGAGTR